MAIEINHPKTGERITEYLSPSRVNSFIECQGEWALKYLYEIETPPPNEKMKRGSDIEEYLNNNLYKSPKGNPHFEHDIDEDDMPCVHLLLDRMDDLFEHFSGHLELQNQVTNFNFKIPLIGFIDYRMGTTIFELKTTTRKPVRKPSDNHIRQVMFYNGWDPEKDDFKLKGTCLIYAILKREPEIHFWISEDLERIGGFEPGEYSIISKNQIMANHVSMKLSLRAMWNHIDFYKNNGYSLVPMDFSHYRLSGYDPQKCMNFMKEKKDKFERGET